MEYIFHSKLMLNSSSKLKQNKKTKKEKRHRAVVFKPFGLQEIVSDQEEYAQHQELREAEHMCKNDYIDKRMRSDSEVGSESAGESWEEKRKELEGTSCRDHKGREAVSVMLRICTQTVGGKGTRTKRSRIATIAEEGTP